MACARKGKCSTVGEAGRGFTSNFIVTAGYVRGVVALLMMGQNSCGLTLE